MPCVTNKGKTKAQLLEELDVLRRELEQSRRQREGLEAALQESMAEYRTLLEGVSEIIYTLDKDGLITTISPAVKPLTGHDPSEMIGRPLSDFVYEEDIPRMKRQFARLKSQA
ncbi:MAG: PAS domain-containing protein, partial [Pseudomonadota bacterium]